MANAPHKNRVPPAKRDHRARRARRRSLCEAAASAETLSTGGAPVVDEDTSPADARSRIERLEAALASAAHRDPLTGLLNRAGFHDTLSRAMRAGTQELGLFVLGLDRFGTVNVELGHDDGDRVLALAVAGLRGHRPDALAVARMSGDEFAVLVSRPATAESATALLCAITAQLPPWTTPYGVSVSVGYASAPDDVQATDLLVAAELAMAAAKAKGGHAAVPANRAMLDAARDRVALEEDLRTAIRARTLHVVYQPQFDVQSGGTRLRGFETLVRWQHPERGFVSPLTLVEAAERGGLILELGACVLELACRDYAALRDALNANLRLSINASVLELQSEHYAERFLETVNHYAIPPMFMEVEVTESAFISKVDVVKRHLETLKAAGVCIALDDFGAGYSALGYLAELPLDVLKVDRAFVRNLDGCTRYRAILAAISSMSQNLGLETVIEGIEDEAMIATLQELGCTYVQGYAFGKPATASHWLSQHAPPTADTKIA